MPHLSLSSRLDTVGVGFKRLSHTTLVFVRPLLWVARFFVAGDLNLQRSDRIGHNKRRLSKLAFLLMLVLLAACTASGAGDPAKVVEQYITAKAAGDENAMRPLLCSTMEASLAQEASSFASLEAKVDGMSCQRQGDSNIVACTGKITVTYGTEKSDFPLSSYSVVQEDGQWKWCGEAP